MPGFGMLGVTLQTIEEVVPFFNSTVEKQVDGLIFWDNFNRANTVSGLGDALVGGSWVIDAGDSEIFNTSARGDGTYAVNSTTNSASVAIGRDFVYGDGRIPQSAGAVIRLNYQDPENTNEIRFGITPAATTLRARSGSVTTIIADGGGSAYGSAIVNRFVVQDVGGGDVSASVYRVGASMDNMTTEFTASAVVEGVGASPPSVEGLKLQMGSQGRTDNIFVCGPNISVVGLGTGQKMRLMGPSLTRSIVIESGGTASLDVSRFALPMDRVEVLDTDDSILGVFESSSYIWGGDEFKFTSASYQ